MKRLLFLLLPVLLLAGCGAKGQEPAYRQISMTEAQSLMETEKNYVILDVRTPEEFAQGHIPGAINIANEQIGREKRPELPDENQLILVYCRSGNRSKQAAGKLAQAGYTNIIEFGGIRDWLGEIVTD